MSIIPGTFTTPPPGTSWRGGFVRDDVTGAIITAGPTQGYLASMFTGDDQAKMQLAVSDDLDTWTPVGYSLAAPDPPATLRDPNLIEYGGKLWCAYTHTNYGIANDFFGLARSDNGGVTWTILADKSVANANTVMGGTIRAAWVDNWYLDDSGVPHLFISVTTDPTFAGPFKKIETHPLTTDMAGAWSTPVRCDTGLPASTLDYSVTKIGATYHLFVKDNTTERICHATGSSYLGPWTVDNTDVIGMAQVEASEVTMLPNGTYRLTFDNYIHAPATGVDQIVNPDADGWRFRHARTGCRDSATLTGGWSAVKWLDGLNRFARIIQPRSVDITPLRRTQPGHSCLIARTGALNVLNNTMTPVSFDTIVYDLDGMFTLTRPGVAVCRVPGEYDVAGYVLWPPGGSGGDRFLQITGNNLDIAGLTSKLPNIANDVHQGVNWPLRLRRGDELRMQVFQNSGITLQPNPVVAPSMSISRKSN